MMVFPNLTKESLDKSKVPSGLAGSMVMICAEWVLDGFQAPLEDIIEDSMDLLLAVGRHLDAKER